MDHIQATAADYANAAASEANRTAKNNTDRIVTLEKEVARLWRVIDQLRMSDPRKRGK